MGRREGWEGAEVLLRPCGWGGGRGAGWQLRAEVWSLRFRSRGLAVMATVKEDSRWDGGASGEGKTWLGAQGQAPKQTGRRPHHFVLVQDQPVVVGHEAEAVPPLLAVLLVLEEVPREDDALVQRHLEGKRAGGEASETAGPPRR